METYNYEIPKSCEKINSLSHKFLILYSRDLTKKDKNKISSCFIEGGPEIIEFNGIKIGLSAKEKIIYDKASQSISKKVLVQNIIVNKKHIVSKVNGKITTKEKLRLFDLDKKLAKNSLLLSSLIRMNIYLELRLNGKVENLIRNVLSKDFWEDFFLIEPLLDNEMVERVTLDILVNLKEKFDDQKLLETLVAYISYEASLNFRDKLKDEFDLPDRLSYIQERIQSYNYSLSFPFVWGAWIEKYSSKSELARFLEKTQLYTQLKQNRLKSLGMLRSYFPLDKDKRELIVTAYEKLKRIKDSSLVDLRFRLDENEQLKKYLMKKNIETKPMFLEKRKFYRNELEEYKMFNYSIYNLLKLGDLNQDYFIRALALKTYGI